MPLKYLSCSSFYCHPQGLEDNAVQLQQRLDGADAWIQQLQSQPSSPEVDSWRISPGEVQILKGEEHILGRGGWGYVAEGVFRCQIVAVKCLHKLIVSRSTIKRVHREIRTMSQLRHPNLVLFIAAVFEHGQAPVIVTELLEINLREAYETNRLENTSLTPIFRDVACALNYLHNHRDPIIHRDVSAPNVLLQVVMKGWRAKLSDFGSANLEKFSKTPGEGAFVYAAPEMFPQSPGVQPSPHTSKIDVYSYGVLLCEVILKHLPEDPSKVPACVQQVQRQWPFMHNLIASCIAWKHTDRPNMARIIEQLNKIVPTRK